MQRTTALRRRTPLKRRTPLAVNGKSDTAQCKSAIQAELRRIVIARDGGCILRTVRHCGGLPDTPGIVRQLK
jgi:hypothetical protein